MCSFQEPATGIIDFLLDCLPFPDADEEEEEEEECGESRGGDEDSIPLPFSPNLAHTTDVTQVCLLPILKNDANRMKLPFPFRFPWTSCPPEPAHQLNHSPSSPPPLLRRRRRRSTPLRGERGGGDVDAITL